MKYQLHPACSAWPEMPPEALHELANDIAANGLHEPLTLTPDGRLLDGRNRALACEIAGVEPQTVVYDGDPALFSLSKNARRRHMSRDQIALVAARLATRGVGNPSFTIGSNEPIGPARQEPSNAEVAAAAGVPETSIKSAKTVLNDGAPEEIEAVKSGKAKLRPTAHAIRARNKPASVSAPPISQPSQAGASPQPKTEWLSFEVPADDSRDWSQVIPKATYDWLAEVYDFVVEQMNTSMSESGLAVNGKAETFVIRDRERAVEWFKNALAAFDEDARQRSASCLEGATPGGEAG